MTHCYNCKKDTENAGQSPYSPFTGMDVCGKCLKVYDRKKKEKVSNDKNLRIAMELMSIQNGEMSVEFQQEQKKTPFIDRPVPKTETGRREQQAHRDGCADGTGWQVFPKRK